MVGRVYINEVLLAAFLQPGEQAMWDAVLMEKEAWMYRQLHLELLLATGIRLQLGASYPTGDEIGLWFHALLVAGAGWEFSRRQPCSVEVGLELLLQDGKALLLEESCPKRQPPGSKVTQEGGQPSSLGQLASSLVPDCSLGFVERLRRNVAVGNLDVWQKYGETLPDLAAIFPC